MTGRHALVTGASRGIGAAIAEELARLGADLTLLGRDSGALEAKRARLAAGHPGRVQCLSLDITDAEAVAAGFAAAAAFGPPAILVNNAGAAESAPFVRMTPAHWQRMLDVNLTGCFNTCHAAAPAMLAAGYGRIVNVASTAGLTGYAYVAAYCAAKHGVIGLTRALAREFATKNITVNAVCPGYTETEMTARTIANITAKTGRSESEARAELAKTNPQGRLVRPEEIADAVGWLVREEAGAVTGQAIAIAGGEVMP